MTVEVCFTQSPVIAGTADTLKRGYLINALSSVQARITDTVIVITLTSEEVTNTIKALSISNTSS